MIRCASREPRHRCTSPTKYEPFERIIWSDIKVDDALHGSGASFLIVSEEPLLNVGSFKRDATMFENLRYY